MQYDSTHVPFNKIASCYKKTLSQWVGDHEEQVITTPNTFKCEQEICVIILPTYTMK